MTFIEGSLGQEQTAQTACEQVGKNIDSAGLYVDYDLIVETVTPMFEGARIKTFVGILAERRLKPLAIPKDSLLPPQQPPETTSAPLNPPSAGRNYPRWLLSSIGAALTHLSQSVRV